MPGLTGNQIFLNNPLSYDSTVASLPNAKHVLDKLTSDGLIDLHRARKYVVPPAQVTGLATTFTLPENAATGGVRVFRNGVGENPANISQPTASQFQLTTAPAGPTNPERLEVVYYPATGLSSNFSDRMNIVVKTTGGTLTKAELADSLLILNLSLNVTFTLPAGVDTSDNGLNFIIYLHTPAYSALFNAGAGDTILWSDSVMFNATNRGGKMVYSFQHRDWMIPRRVNATGTLFAPYPTQATSLSPITEES